jgi:hypothetical protein
MPTSRLGLVAGPNAARWRRLQGWQKQLFRVRQQRCRHQLNCGCRAGHPLFPPPRVDTNEAGAASAACQLFLSHVKTQTHTAPVRLTTRTGHPSADSNLQISRASRRWRSWWRRRAQRHRQGSGRWAEALGPMRSGPRRRGCSRWRGGAGTAPRGADASRRWLP